MRVLLFGGTGRLGSRCIQAHLAHGHVLTVYVRNTDKLKTMVTPAVINSLEAVVAGDATDSVAIKKAIEEHNIEAIVDVAGNQVLPWKEFVLSKIAKAVTDAAVAVGKERGKPIRVWLITWPGELKLSGSENALEDFFPMAAAQHVATAEVVKAIPVSDLKWSLLCVAWMYDAPPKQNALDLLPSPRHHTLTVQSSVLPGWKWSFLSNLPYVGGFFKRFEVWLNTILEYGAYYEDVADLLAEDLESGDDSRVGKLVGYKQMGAKST